MRRIDPKFHIEGDQIIKTSNGDPIPEDEPLMLFRARDRNALAVLYEYRRLCVLDGCNDFQMDGIHNRILAFEKFRDTQSERMKQPGITRGK